jgi:hypothetical protein
VSACIHFTLGRTRHLWSDHRSRALARLILIKLRRKAPLEACPVSDPLPLPIPPSADPHRSPPSRVEGKSGTPYPRKRSAPCAILRAVPHAKLRDPVYRPNPEMARMVGGEGFCIENPLTPTGWSRRKAVIREARGRTVAVGRDGYPPRGKSQEPDVGVNSSTRGCLSRLSLVMGRHCSTHNGTLKQASARMRRARRHPQETRRGLRRLIGIWRAPCQGRRISARRYVVTSIASRPFLIELRKPARPDPSARSLRV